MVRITRYLVVFISILFFTTAASAQPIIIDSAMKRLDGDENSRYVKYSWKVLIEADSEMTCFINISLRDDDDMEFSSVTEYVHIVPGENLFTGTRTIKSKSWFSMKSAPVRLSGCTDR